MEDSYSPPCDSCGKPAKVHWREPMTGQRFCDQLLKKPMRIASEAVRYIDDKPAKRAVAASLAAETGPQGEGHPHKQTPGPDYYGHPDYYGPLCLDSEEGISCLPPVKLATADDLKQIESERELVDAYKSANAIQQQTNGYQQGLKEGYARGAKYLLYWITLAATWGAFLGALAQWAIPTLF